MANLRSLLSQTAVYGLSSILGRLLNYLLISLHTRVFTDPGQMGVVTDLYAYVTFLLIVFTYGMETAFFRFSNQHKEKNVQGTALFSLLLSSVLLTAALSLFAGPIADFLKYPNHPEYIVWFALILGLDALTAIPFAQLRLQNKAGRFAGLKFINILINIFFNVFFLLICPWWLKSHPGSTLFFYDPAIGIGYIFIANLLASLFTVLLMLPEFLRTQWEFDPKLWKAMLIYALPLLVAGFAGMINETLDRILLKFYLPGTTEQNLVQTGIYGSAYKLSIFMTLAIQAFRMAAEPFYFAQSDKEHAQETYALVMKHFVNVCLFIFLGVMAYMDIVRYIIHPNYWEGIKVVPILLLANLFLGVYYNLSVWYKVSGKTIYGAWIAIFGALVTLLVNLTLIPTMGYMASAWATLACYTLMALVCYLVGQRFYKVPYPMGRMLAYLFFALLLFVGMQYVAHCCAEQLSLKIFLNTLLLAVFVGVVFLVERPLKRTKLS